MNVDGTHQLSHSNLTDIEILNLSLSESQNFNNLQTSQHTLLSDSAVVKEVLTQQSLLAEAPRALT